MNIKLVHIFLVLSIFVFIFSVTSKLNAPLVIWDYAYYSTAENWSKGINSEWSIDHPPGYPLFLTLIFKIFGAGIPVARLANAFCILG